jgi:hypothetical protein
MTYLTTYLSKNGSTKKQKKKKTPNKKKKKKTEPWRTTLNITSNKNLTFFNNILCGRQG